MADADNITEAKNFYLDVPAESKPFFLKGANSLGWGLQNRFSRIFNPESGRTVMLAIDHGYFMGPTTGLERVMHSC
jgi:putative autoinducer-2 (AI-2) aldolase